MKRGKAEQKKTEAMQTLNPNCNTLKNLIKQFKTFFKKFKPFVSYNGLIKFTKVVCGVCKCGSKMKVCSLRKALSINIFEMSMNCSICPDFHLYGP